MRHSLFSPLWYRVASLRPRLHFDVSIEQQRHRGQMWYLLVDEASARQFRLNPEAYAFVGRLDGIRTVQQVWDALLDADGDLAPTQDEVLQLLGQLSERGLLESEVEDGSGANGKAGRGGRGMLNPLAFRIPLGDPSTLLERLDFVRKLMFVPGAFLIWLVCVLTGLVTAALYGNELVTATQGTRWLVYGWLAFPVLKFFHELAHGLAVRQFGGEVHKAGITLFLLTPAPYVDASAAASFRSRRRRLMVGAAGVMAELLIASLALLLWLNVQAGVLRDVAFAVLFTASVSTLLFNGNPLLRFDAYYVMCDLLDLPNLGLRSNQWWAQRLRRAMGAQRTTPGFVPTQGEAKWLVCYAPLALACRLILGLGVVLWLGSISLALGIAAGVLCLLGLAFPLYRAIRRLWGDSLASGTRPRVAFRLLGVSAVLLVLVFALPVPSQTSAIGVVWLPDQARIRTESAGFITRLKQRDGTGVRAGDVLVELEDPALEATRERLKSRLAELNAERYSALGTAKFESASGTEEDIATTEAQLRNIETKIAGLSVRSNTDGVLMLPRAEDMPGTYADRGATLGYVLDREQVVVRTAVEQQDAALVRERTRRVEVRLAESPGETLQAQLVREVPAAGTELPSAALGDTAGGPLVTDPEDKKGLRVVQPVVLLDLKVPARQLERVGGRAWVRFDHGLEPIASQVYRYGRQLFLARFNPAQ